MPERILLVHNYYQIHGGEDTVFHMERKLLADFGHEVVTHTADNSSIGGIPPLQLVFKVFWNRESLQALKQLIREVRPDIVHFHNIFPLMSPSVYDAARSEGVAVVQTLHNYRLVCINAVLYRDGNVCQACVGQVPWRGVVHRCYRDSYIQSLVSAAVLLFHRIRRTWSAGVDAYITLTDFARSIVLRSGLSPDKVYTRPNFVYPDPGAGTEERQGKALFIGRLVTEKGVDLLLDAWSELVNIPLEIIGEGTEKISLDRFQEMQGTGVLCYFGAKPHTEVIEKLKQAPFLVFPSCWYEGFPMTILESFACGTPVVAPSLGVMADLVEDMRTGLHFIPGDARDLARKVQWAWEHPEQMQGMGREARKIFLEKYAAEKSYQRLMEIYRNAIASRAEGW